MTIDPRVLPLMFEPCFKMGSPFFDEIHRPVIRQLSPYFYCGLFLGLQAHCHTDKSDPAQAGVSHEHMQWERGADPCNLPHISHSVPPWNPNHSGIHDYSTTQLSVLQLLWHIKMPPRL